MRLFSRLFSILVLLAAAASSGCNNQDNKATFSLSVADTPTDDATHVTVTFTGVRFQGSDPAPVVFRLAQPIEVDLLQEQNGNSTVLLNTVDLPADTYHAVTLVTDVSSATLTLKDGSVHPLLLPDSGLITLTQDFAVTDGAILSYTLDFDLRRSILRSASSGGGSTYSLIPKLRLVDTRAGMITGSVPASLMLGGMSIADNACSPAVYVYAGTDVMPVDIAPGEPVQPLETATLTLDIDTGNYLYTAAFLVPGDYTLAVVCAGLDDPSASDSLVFSGIKDATLTDAEHITLDFP